MNTSKATRLIHRLRPSHAVIALLSIHVFLLAWSAARHSPSIDEVGHMAAGLSHWHTKDFDLYRVNPPLVRLVATSPLAAIDVREPEQIAKPHPLARPEFGLGREFVNTQGTRAFWYFTLARWACLPFAVLAGYVCYLWGKELYGEKAGLLSIALWCFCPIVLANAQMITPDTGATAFGVLVAYVFWKWCRDASWTNSYFMGLGLGIALLCKTTWIILFPLWPLIWLTLRFTERPLRPRRQWFVEAGQLATAFLLCLLTVNVGYLCEDPFVELGDFPFISKALTIQEAEKATNRFAGTSLEGIPVPFPRNFVMGIDVQRHDFESRYWSYLRGEWRQEGWWYYYLYGLAVKWPLGTWLLLLLAIGSLSFLKAQGVNWRDEFVLLSPALALFALVSSQTGFNHHIRYVLPAFPFFFIWIGRVTLGFRKSRIWACCVLVLLGFSIAGSLRVYPHSMSYFNELAGGPMNGHAHLVDSNIDWGQDLLYLKKWVDAHPEVQPLGLAYFGYIDPRVAGIEFSIPPKGVLDAVALDSPNVAERGPRAGWYAVSVTLLRGYRYAIADGKGGMVYLDREYYRYFLHFKPVATAGYSIYIYHLTEDDCNRIRSQIGMPGER